MDQIATGEIASSEHERMLMDAFEILAFADFGDELVVVVVDCVRQIPPILGCVRIVAVQLGLKVIELSDKLLAVKCTRYQIMTYDEVVQSDVRSRFQFGVVDLRRHKVPINWLHHPHCSAND